MQSDIPTTSDVKTLNATIGPRPDALLTVAGILLVTTGSGNDTIAVDSDGRNLHLHRNGTLTTYALGDVDGGGETTAARA